jgi:hypothetical protein
VLGVCGSEFARSVGTVSLVRVALQCVRIGSLVSGGCVCVCVCVCMWHVRVLTRQGPHKLVAEAIKAKTFDCHMLPPAVFAQGRKEWLPAGLFYLRASIFCFMVTRGITWIISNTITNIQRCHTDTFLQEIAVQVMPVLPCSSFYSFLALL